MKKYLTHRVLAETNPQDIDHLDIHLLKRQDLKFISPVGHPSVQEARRSFPSRRQMQQTLEYLEKPNHCQTQWTSLSKRRDVPP